MLKGISFLNKGLRYKLMLAFSLMSVIPLLACIYLISAYIFPHLSELIDSSIVIAISIVVSILGLILARGIIDPIVTMAIEAKAIASGEYHRSIAVSSDDEVGNIAEAINQMTRQIRSNLDEVKGYSQKLKEINGEIHKKVIALSSLLQIGDTIAMSSAQIDDILEITVEKAAAVLENAFAVVYLPATEGGDYVAKVAYNTFNDRISRLVVKPGGRGVLDLALKGTAPLVVDKTARTTDEMNQFRTLYDVRNFVAVPLIFGRKTLGLLVVGNNQEDFKFRTDELDLLKVFVKQMTIAIEKDLLSRKAEEYAVKDDLTELYNRSYILERLEEEIKRAVFYQRPCSLIVLNVDSFKKFREDLGELVAEEVLKKMARVVRDHVTPVGKAARIGVDEFAMLLPEKNKKEAALIAEEVRKKIEATNMLREGRATLTVSGGVSENPIDGATREELFRRAIDAVKEAKTRGRNRIVA